MGTALNERGISFKECFETASLEHPSWVLEIHRGHLAAGAEGVHTNTFGANRYRLDGHGREGDLEAIVEASCRLAHEAADGAAGGPALVIGAIGPLGVQIEPLGRVSHAEARAAFRELAALLIPRVDAISLETFSNAEEAVEALRAIRELGDLPVLAHLTVVNSGRTLFGTSVEDGAEMLAAAGADVLGLNCSTGPRAVLEACLRLAAVTDLPLSARPNAGLPREVEGRVFYQSSPDYFARFARRFLEAGGRVLGGCCGTTPEHVRAMARALGAARARQRGNPLSATPRSRAQRIAERPRRPLPVEERSRLGRALADGRRPVSVELVPPRSPDLNALCTAARRVHDAGATCVNLPDGPRASARVSNRAAAAILERETGVETLVHFCCRDRNLLGMQSDLLGAAALGLRNLLIITGDPPYQGNYPDLTAVFDVDAIGLCNIVDHLNHGLDLGGNAMEAQTHFCFGAALNPFALDQERERNRLHWKIDAGVDFLITQPVFDPPAFQRFLEDLSEPLPPLLAGIWPLRSLRNAEFLASEVPGVQVPDAVLERMRIADERGGAAQEGLAIALENLEALHDTVQGYQIAAPFNRVEQVLPLLEAALALA